MNKKLHFIIVALNSLIATTSFGATPCKAYIKLDLGYSIAGQSQAYGPGFYNNGTNWVGYQTRMGPYLDERGMVGDIAVGYGFNDAMRGEISFDFKPKMHAKYNYFAVENEEYGGSARVLYDFNNNTFVTPFVFGSLGALSIKPKISPYINPDDKHLGNAYLATIDNTGALITDTNGNILTYSSLSMPSQTVMTYQAGFGLAFKMSEEVSIDCTYGFGGKTNYRFLSNISTIVETDLASINGNSRTERLTQLKLKNQIDQSLTVGIRFTM